MKVLLSKEYGAGWSTWNDPRMAFDPDLIELVEHGCTFNEMYDACVAKGYLDIYGKGPYMGGFKNLTVVEVPAGRYFRIKEYDGNEYIEYFDMSDWVLSE